MNRFLYAYKGIYLYLFGFFAVLGYIVLKILGLDFDIYMLGLGLVQSGLVVVGFVLLAKLLLRKKQYSPLLINIFYLISCGLYFFLLSIEIEPEKYKYLEKTNSSSVQKMIDAAMQDEKINTLEYIRIFEELEKQRVQLAKDK